MTTFFKQCEGMDKSILPIFESIFLNYFQGYKPTIFYPKRVNKPLYDNLFKHCEGMDMPVLSTFPSEVHLITDSYNFVVHALFDFSFKRESNRKAINRNWSNQKANPAPKPKREINKYYK